MTAAVALRGIEKSFGATRALCGVDLALAPGSVHALVGENGAGKSTLMKVLSGALSPDAGTITVVGRAMRFRGPVDARAAGVALVHQELSLFPHLSVEDNVVMGCEDRRLGFLRSARNRARVRDVLGRLGHPDLQPETRVGSLPVGAQQIVEICRAVSGPTRVLLLDEPTSSLERGDAERLFSLVRTMRDQGMAIVYISHFLEEVRALADTFTVLRDGASVGTGAIEAATDEQIVTMMVGRKVTELFPARDAGEPGPVRLNIQRLTAPRVQAVSMTVRSGEVVGLFGIVGAGRTELLRALTGLVPATGGRIEINEQPAGLREPARVRLRRGIGYLSEDRKGEGLALPLSIADNVTLSAWDRVARHGFIAGVGQARATVEVMKRLGIRASGPAQPVGSLSGGNQQKVALGRLVFQDADVWLLDEPTRGVDIGAKVNLYAQIRAAARAGKAIVVASSYLPELMGLCDRLAVVCRGRLSAALPIAAWSPESVMRVATGTEPLTEVAA